MVFALAGSRDRCSTPRGADPSAGLPIGAIVGSSAGREIRQHGREDLRRHDVLLAFEDAVAPVRQGLAIVLGLLRVATDAGRGVLVVTHDAAVTARADRVLSLRDGRLE